jgi:hypothetical protein
VEPLGAGDWVGATLLSKPKPPKPIKRNRAIRQAVTMPTAQTNLNTRPLDPSRSSVIGLPAITIAPVSFVQQKALPKVAYHNEHARPKPKRLELSGTPLNLGCGVVGIPLQVGPYRKPGRPQRPGFFLRLARATRPECNPVNARGRYARKPETLKAIPVSISSTASGLG